MNLFVFNPGDLIVSSQINENFQEFVRVLGKNSTASELALPGRITVGPSRKASISAITDKVDGEHKYLHLGWNAEEYIEGTSVKLQRNSEQGSSSVVRVGSDGFEFLYSSATQGVSATSKVFGIDGNNKVFIHENWSVVSRSGSAQSISEYRLMLTPLTTPVSVYASKQAVSANSSLVFDLATFISQANFHGVEVQVTAQAASSASSDVSVYGQGLSPYTGLVLNLGSNQKDSARGCVVLKRGTEPNQKLVVSNTGSLSSLTITVIGLWK